MKVQEKHGKVAQNMHGASRNYRYVWDVSVVPMGRYECCDIMPSHKFELYSKSWYERLLMPDSFGKVQLVVPMSRYE